MIACAAGLTSGHQTWDRTAGREREDLAARITLQANDDEKRGGMQEKEDYVYRLMGSRGSGRRACQCLPLGRRTGRYGVSQADRSTFSFFPHLLRQDGDLVKICNRN